MELIYLLILNIFICMHIDNLNATCLYNVYNKMKRERHLESFRHISIVQ